MILTEKRGEKMDNNNGYTLIELILVVAILAMMSLPMFTFFSQSMEVQSLSEYTLRADYFAQKYLEAYKGDALPSEHVSETSAHGITTTVFEEDGFTVTVNESGAALDMVSDNTTVPDYVQDISKERLKLTITGSDKPNIQIENGSTVLIRTLESDDHNFDFTIQDDDGNDGNRLVVGTTLGGHDASQTVNVHNRYGEGTPFVVTVYMNGETTDPIRLNFTNASDDTVEIYEFDDDDDVLTIGTTARSGQISKTSNLSSQVGETANGDGLKNVEIVVTRAIDGRMMEFARIISLKNK